MTIQRWFGARITGLAADTKPLTEPAGTTFVETDTQKRFIFDTAISQWIPQDFPQYKQFRVMRPGTTTYVVDIHGRRAGSNNDTQTAVQSVVDQIQNNQIFDFVWDAGNWDMTNPITFPTTSAIGAIKKTIMRGVTPSWARGTNGYARLVPSATWPDQRCLFELNNPSLLAINGYVQIENFGATSGNADPATRKVGFVKFESGNINLGRFYHIARNLHLEYMWRGIWIRGMTWFGLFDHIYTQHSSTTFNGDASFVIEDGGIVDPAQNPNPKGCVFRNVCQSAGDGLQQNYIRISTGGYHYFDNFFIDGKFFADSVIKLGGGLGTSKNYFCNITTLDMEFPTPNTTKASLYLTGTAGTNECYDNTFINCHWSNLPESILLEGNGVMNNRIEADRVWGVALTKVTDTTAATGTNANTIKMFGNANPATANGKIVHTGGTSRVIDEHKGAENGGIATARTDGSTIAHGLWTTPAWYIVTGSIAGQIVTATANATVLTLGIKTGAGAAGTSQSIAWRAGVYA